MKLVDIAALVPDAIIDLRYATTNNITNRILYTSKEQSMPQLDKPAALSLVTVAALLREQSYRLVIWDAYRPTEVQIALLAAESDNRYVNPKSNHCLGLATDITIADKAGNYLDMGTDFDEFSPAAHSDYNDLTTEQTTNRQILESAMTAAGFKQWPYEWWHFDYDTAKK